MRKIWREFKSFALSGSMLDLALGFIIGTAFATVVDSATNNVIMPLISATFGKANFSSLIVTINGTQIHYGSFLTDILNFILFAAILFLLLKMIASVGVGRARTFEEKQCPYCLEYIAPNALVCKVCRQPLVAELPGLADAEARAAKLRERHRLNLPDLPDIELAELADLAKLPVSRLHRKNVTTATTVTTATHTIAVEDADGSAPSDPGGTI
jgi:large conductance mechanosensitive channel